MAIILGVAVAVVLLVIFACLKMAGDCDKAAERQQQESPCETCLCREECDQCQHKKGGACK